MAAIPKNVPTRGQQGFQKNTGGSKSPTLQTIPSPPKDNSARTQTQAEIERVKTSHKAVTVKEPEWASGEDIQTTREEFYPNGKLKYRFRENLLAISPLKKSSGLTAT